MLPRPQLPARPVARNAHSRGTCNALVSGVTACDVYCACTGTGRDEGSACVQAMDIGRGSVLAEVEPSRVRADTQMVCSDIPDIRIRPVRIGEVVWESETDMHRHEQERKYFDYKQTKCRMFTERNSKDRNLYTYQGIICKADTNPNGKWQVVDKY